MLKRPRGVDSSPVDQRSKRRHVSFPQTPVASASYSTPSKTPYTPYPLRASDSPSNPFGRKRTQRLIHTLPAETSFSKHLALRFQFVRRGVGPKQGGVYRVVQVPQSYTFTHLRCLIAFLFGVRSRGSGLEEDEHLFEIKKKVALYSARHKPGQIKVGKTWAKLSSVQDPCRWRSMYGRDALEDDEDEEEVDENEEAEVELEEDEGGEWKWEDEEVLTVAHAWPEGVDTERGIIYHHSRTTQVHITINTTTIPRRKGISNLPFVFTARGRVHLSPLPLPPPNFAPLLKLKQATTKAKKAPVKSVPRRASSSKLSRESRRTLAELDADGDSDSEFETSRPFDENHPFVTSNYDDEIASETEEEEDDSDGEEDIDATLNPCKWNDPEDAFEQYLAWFMGPPPATEEDSTEEEDKENSNTSMMSTPGLSLSSSPGIPSSTFSSPFRSSSPTSSSGFSLYSPSSFPLSDHYPNKKYKYTPAPPKAKVARMRIERVQKRMEKAKRDKWLCARDESPEVKGADVDELLDDDDGDDDVGDDGKWVKPVLKPGEVWDPFGDEPEI